MLMNMNVCTGCTSGCPNKLHAVVSVCRQLASLYNGVELYRQAQDYVRLAN